MFPFCCFRKFGRRRALGVSLTILAVALSARAVTEVVVAATASPAPTAPALKPPQFRSQQPFPSDDSETSGQLSRKQRRDLVKHNFERMKRDAEALAALAQSLQDDLSKSNQNVLSLKIVEKAEKIEKLAKRIKEAAKGH